MTIRRWLGALAAVGCVLGFGVAAQAGPTLDKVKQAGQISCGVPTGIAGFAAPDSQGHWAGFDVDICRALSAAIFGAADKVKYVPLTAQQRFTALQSGEVDLLSNNTTDTCSATPRSASISRRSCSMTARASWCRRSSASKAPRN